MNPAQIRKTLQSTSHHYSRAFELVYGIKSNLDEELVSRLKTLPQGSTVLLLGRYRNDIDRYLNKDLTSKYDHHAKVTRISCKLRGDLNIRFRTAHGSKGLQADYVFILNNERSKYGFPSNIEDDPVLNLVLQEEETFPHAEERRLFYVALTRAKKDVYLMVNRESKSAFIREIEKEYGIIDSSEPGHEPCPKCRTGKLVRRQSTYGAFYGCSHYPRCEYTRNIYSNQSRKRKIRI